ncbi:hypothetical protein SNEBB_003578 [Seison nebaliae]|nr:hypothetical protein SNEBB_003578 [Seison nebaliae]
MFEARLATSTLLKKTIDAIKELVKESVWECSCQGLCLQSMDSSHVALVAVLLRGEGFEHFRCDRNLSLGINIESMSKILRCSTNDDEVTLKAPDDADKLTFLFEQTDHDKSSEFEMKLMELEAYQLTIPEQDYACIINMPSGEFSRICRDLAMFGDSIKVVCTKDGVRFSASGDIGNGSIKISESSGTADKPDDAIKIELNSSVSLDFSLKYLSLFSKAQPISSRVSLSISENAPLVVEYEISEMGYIRYYLAPKIDDS